MPTHSRHSRPDRRGGPVAAAPSSKGAHQDGSIHVALALGRARFHDLYRAPRDGVRRGGERRRVDDVLGHGRQPAARRPRERRGRRERERLRGRARGPQHGNDRPGHEIRCRRQLHGRDRGTGHGRRSGVRSDLGRGGAERRPVRGRQGERPRDAVRRPRQLPRSVGWPRFGERTVQQRRRHRRRLPRERLRRRHPQQADPEVHLVGRLAHRLAGRARGDRLAARGRDRQRRRGLCRRRELRAALRHRRRVALGVVVDGRHGDRRSTRRITPG